MTSDEYVWVDQTGRESVFPLRCSDCRHGMQVSAFLRSCGAGVFSAAQQPLYMRPICELFAPMVPRHFENVESGGLLALHQLCFEDDSDDTTAE